MDDGLLRSAAAERATALPPVPGAGGDGDLSTAGALDDPRALQILSTEHWSLLTHRSLAYNEAFSRAGMFLTTLSASMVAIAFVAQADAFGEAFRLFATVVLALDLFIGLATYVRLIDATREDLRALQGMNRIRHAYLEMTPRLRRYFVTSDRDDLRGIFATYGEAGSTSRLGNLIHGYSTTTGMIGVVTALVGGSLAALLVGRGGTSMGGVVIAGVAVFVALNAALLRWSYISVMGMERDLRVEFPSDAAEGGGPGGPPGVG
jgi:hypothetical protein